MKRVYKSPATPERLRSYVKAFPDETWEHFRRRNRRGYREVKQQLLQDQHGLCAYCEISIKLAEFEDNVDDFRVEHFFPKVATQLEKHNYHLDWPNRILQYELLMILSFTIGEEIISSISCVTTIASPKYFRTVL